MKDLFKIMLTLAIIFASTFLILKATGVLTVEEIKQYIVDAHNTNKLYLVLIIVILLFLDLFIAIPTMSVAILSGYFLGWKLGLVATITGFYLAGVTGYFLSLIYGNRLLNFIYKDKKRLEDIEKTFFEYGPIILIISRATPILPEVSCCMAGATRMSFMKFILMYSLGTIPYAIIITYAGSISSIEKPMPAILTTIGVTLVLWVSWYAFNRYKSEN